MRRERGRTRRVKKQAFLIAVFMLGLVGLVGKMSYIYVVNGEDFESQAIRQQVFSNTRSPHVDRVINPNRGSILDRNGQVMAHSHTVYNIFIDVRRLAELKAATDTRSANEMEAVLDAIEELLDIPRADILEFMAINPETGKPNRDTHFLIIKRGVSAVTETQLRNLNLRHVHSEEDTVRSYPAGNIAGNIIGFLSGDGNHWGMEGSLNHWLTGTPGREVRMFDETGTVTTNEFRPITGYTVVTTLDMPMQQAAVEIARDYGEQSDANTAQVLVMNPNTGEVLAMAQYPNFDNNEPFNIELINSTRYREELEAASEAERVNTLFRLWSTTAVSKTFEPGSTFKAIIGSAALEEGLTYPGEQFFCPGFHEVGGRRINCWTWNLRRTGHGVISLEDAMAESCNVVFMILGQRLGRDKVYEYARDFGVGAPTGVDIAGEPSQASFNTVTYSRNQLNPVELATTSMGQGFNITSIQMLTAFSTVINGGYLVTPHLISGVFNEDEVIMQNTGAVRRNILSHETSDFWRSAMVRTVESETATGRMAYIEGFKIGGKTGTAEQGVRAIGTGEEELTYSMIGYLPADEPQYIVMVVVDRPRIEVASVSSLMLRDVMEAIIRQRAVMPYTAELTPRTIMVTVEDYTDTNVLDSIRRITEKGLVAESVGTGNIVTHQLPLEGSVVSPGTRVMLYLADEESSSEQVTVPDVTGLSLLHARETLSALELEARVMQRNPDESNSQVMKVINQMPIEGVRLPRGSEVTLIVDLYESEVEVE